MQGKGDKIRVDLDNRRIIKKGVCMQCTCVRVSTEHRELYKT
eukprot:SAG25_NODE_7228_length_494_cov_1.265823_2_plen_41_part_01